MRTRTYLVNYRMQLLQLRGGEFFPGAILFSEVGTIFFLAGATFPP